jgi:hypothetical protein
MSKKTMNKPTEAVWEKEITRRVAELNAGIVKTIPWAEVRRRVLAKLPQTSKSDKVSKPKWCHPI